MIDPRAVRRTILDCLYHSGAGHLGSAMSTVEMLVAMYAFVDVDKIKRGDADRARIVISKGHCAAAVYSVMHHYGLIDAMMLATYYWEGSTLTGLVNHEVPGVEHSTGSLGHGLSVAAGMALALRNRGSDSPVLCLVGDGELQEGSNWEAFLLLKHLNLTNCIVLVDDNGIGMIDRTEKVIDMRPLTERFRGLGLMVAEVDGHNADAILEQLRMTHRFWKMPGVLICKTVKGKGVKVAEDQILWHYRTLNKETYQQVKEALL